MRVLTGRVGGAARRVGARHRTIVAVVGGALAVLPAVAATNSTASFVNISSTEHSRDAALEGGYDPKAITFVGVDGSLPQAPKPIPLPAYELPSGPLGIPGTALKAYHNAADMMAKLQPGCHIDWALIASIGRIESNHARGGYVDAKGNTLEPILGPVLNGLGAVAAIPDTDGGRYDGDVVWDRAVGPMQFIPATWYAYASDGNGDGETNPNNIFDAALGTARYLCSGGLDLANPDNLRTAIYRYNNSDAYVNSVIMWAEGYRKGVAPLPDSKVPVGAPDAATQPPPPAVPPPPAPVTPPPPPVTTTPGGSGNLPPSHNTSTGTKPTKPTTPTTTTPTCTTSPPPTSTTAPPPTTGLPPCNPTTTPSTGSTSSSKAGSGTSTS
ncbi:lytic transglycosylase domain-containing protein [Amycolatopsis sp. CA-230715]|uniref:lytic transglycosylase domain-containing protein n=1 Tax=Amycolatopsis sp. CA-230715 TaxID=2745196 RepID=UPI001C03236D|nr:lytic murein transglycosylase [Amycolatopsis sp. CA-230715]